MTALAGSSVAFAAAAARPSSATPGLTPMGAAGSLGGSKKLEKGSSYGRILAKRVLRMNIGKKGSNIGEYWQNES